MMGARSLAVLVLVATWGSWRWFWNRATAAPEETLALGFTILLLGVLALPRLRGGAALAAVPLAPVTGLIALHAVLAFFAPPIFPAAVAVAALLYVLFRAVFAMRPPVAFWGLVALSMPVLPSLQFMLGYPMRIVSAMLTVGLLRLQGLPIVREGTYVTAGGETVQFDAPCSGVSMLWALVLVTLMIGLVQRMGAVRLAGALVLTLAVGIGCNALRVASLIYAEAAMGGGVAGLHEGVGLAAFALSAVALAFVLKRDVFAGSRGVAA